MDVLEMFKKLRDGAGEVVAALESGDNDKFETSIGKFMFLMIQFKALK
ncbi:hypothetical protein [Desulfosporosinus lacus]|uniref:Uncharacterized protein n=1 Tax=Desulfosporosinus lacus DSM 15449 TaxID=1121420 RepID=A0A1M5WIB7_9FIRM|nr:hypothetical protein [Desulfosporosinus lacus]SHH86974.1 hypothetical protein SAMN02746098_01622 [Desulfosporosinus lacus DSM 15449]